MPKKKMIGVIVSDKMNQTATVAVETIKKHLRYLKRYRSHVKYLADNPDNLYKLGDKVIIEECRPLSRRKRWRIIDKAK
jgi:small subunit ribosomal protein S17